MSPASVRRRVACVVIAAMPLATAGCNSDDSCSGSPEMFVAYAPGAAVADIPLCTNAGASSTVTMLDGAFADPFPGAPVSAAAAAQCEVICSAANASLPCCLSMWEPDTVLCPPSCVPSN